MNQDVIRIINILEFRRAPVRIKQRRVTEWLQSGDPNVVAAATDAILMHNDFISPKLNDGEILAILQRNFAINLSTPKAPTLYSHSCYEAGRALFMWVLLQADSDYVLNNVDALDVLSTNLANLYLTASPDQKDCIVNGVLEHLFENDAVREHFVTWQAQPELNDAYVRAGRWSDWSRTRRSSLEEITEKTAERLRQAGYSNAFVNWPVPGSVIPEICMDEQTLMVSCDEVWVELFQARRLNLDLAADFAANEKHWRPAAEIGRAQIVELSGRSFEV
jgi:hypothetical protein